MARYQELPNREAGNAVCACAVVPDLTMCQAYAMRFECTINAGSIGKNRIEVFGTGGGSCNFTVPSGVTSIFIEMWGGGGGGSGNGNCCCCHMGIPGGGGGYVAATIPTAAGCVYSICAGAGGSHGCGPCGSTVTCGQCSYVTGYNLSGFAAGGAQGTCNPCNDGNYTCYGTNWCNDSSRGCIGSSTYANNVLMACGESGHVFGRPQGCRADGISGSAPFAGGAGVWTTYNQCCQYAPYTAPGGQFPGGGGGGAHMSCCCGICTCGGCGASGLVRIWY